MCKTQPAHAGFFFQQYLAVTHCTLEMCGVSAFRYSQKYAIFFLLSSAWGSQCVLNSIFVNPAALHRAEVVSEERCVCAMLGLTEFFSTV